MPRQNRLGICPAVIGMTKGELLPDQLALQDIVDLLGPLLTDSSLPKIGHNLKYDYAILAAPQNGGIRLAGPLYDTMLGAWLLDPGRRSYKLDDLCQELDLKLTPFSEVVAGDKAPDAFCRVPPGRPKITAAKMFTAACAFLRSSEPNWKSRACGNFLPRWKGR